MGLAAYLSARVVLLHPAGVMLCAVQHADAVSDSSAAMCQQLQSKKVVWAGLLSFVMAGQNCWFYIYVGSEKTVVIVHQYKAWQENKNILLFLLLLLSMLIWLTKCLSPAEVWESHVGNVLTFVAGTRLKKWFKCQRWSVGVITCGRGCQRWQKMRARKRGSNQRRAWSLWVVFPKRFTSYISRTYVNKGIVCFFRVLYFKTSDFFIFFWIYDWLTSLKKLKLSCVNSRLTEPGAAECCRVWGTAVAGVQTASEWDWPSPGALLQHAPSLVLQSAPCAHLALRQRLPLLPQSAPASPPHRQCSFHETPILGFWGLMCLVFVSSCVFCTALLFCTSAGLFLSLLHHCCFCSACFLFWYF